MSAVTNITNCPTCNARVEHYYMFCVVCGGGLYAPNPVIGETERDFEKKFQSSSPAKKMKTSNRE